MRHFTTCAHCFREMAEVRVDLGIGPRQWVHRRCLEGWVNTVDGAWFLDGEILWTSYLTGNYAQVVQGNRGARWLVFNSDGIQAFGKTSGIMEAQTLAERAGS